MGRGGLTESDVSELKVELQTEAAVDDEEIDDDAILEACMELERKNNIDEASSGTPSADSPTNRSGKRRAPDEPPSAPESPPKRPSPAISSDVLAPMSPPRPNLPPDAKRPRGNIYDQLGALS